MIGCQRCRVGDLVIVKTGCVICVGKGVRRDRVDVDVGGGEDLMFLHFFKLVTEDCDDVVYSGLWDIDVDEEGASCSGVIGVDACEVKVIDEFRCVIW